MLFNSTKVLNEEMQPCRVDEVGELFIKGPHVFSYYWKNPTETADALDEGWLRTGDFAKYDSDGDTYIVGRKKDMIITGGENVYPQEVEQCLVLFDGVNEVAVVGVKDEIWGKIIVAFIVIADGYSFNFNDITMHCRTFLGSYKVPKKVIVLKELPKTHVEKLIKKRCKDWLENNKSVRHRALTLFRMNK